jgi:Sulfotransferase family
LPNSLSTLSSHCGYYFSGAFSGVRNCRDRWFDRSAAAFYSELIGEGFAPNSHIDVLPRHRLIYVCVPKCASTTIKMTLSGLTSRRPGSFDELHKRRFSGLTSPARVGVARFYRLATSPQTLRFAFVRNPYARLVSAWADKFQNKPLAPGEDSFVDQYLVGRRSTDASLPAGPESTLSFAQFVRYAAATANDRIDAHWHLQDDILNMPGIKLDLVGKVETFHADFAHVLDHIGADGRTRQLSYVAYNPSQHRPWQSYYSRDIADCVYRAYRRDFDRFGYSREIAAENV